MGSSNIIECAVQLEKLLLELFKRLKFIAINLMILTFQESLNTLSQDTSGPLDCKSQNEEVIYSYFLTSMHVEEKSFKWNLGIFIIKFLEAKLYQLFSGMT